jgi:V/A-type H+-transporting ATPase subunit C
MAFYADKAILTKIKAMYGHRLTEENYMELLHKQSVGDITGYLKGQTHYQAVLISVQETMIHRGQLESLLHHSLFADYLKLLRFAKWGNDFFSYYRISLEVGQLLNCIAYLNSSGPNEYFSELPGYLIGQLSIDLTAMAHARGFADLLQALDGTPYHKVLEPLLSQARDSVDIAACERALMEYYYHTVFAMVDRYYTGGENKEIKSLFYLQAEISNITAIYRLKRFFHADEETIRRHILPFYSELSPELISRMISARDMDQFWELFKKIRFSRYFGDDSEMYIEQSAQNMRYYNSRKLLYFTRSPAAAFTAFIQLGQLEITNIINIVEGVRYKVPPEEIEKLLIR